MNEETCIECTALCGPTTLTQREADSIDLAPRCEMWEAFGEERCADPITGEWL